MVDMNMKKYLALAALAAIAAESQSSIYAGTNRVDFSKPYPKKTSLPAWKIGEYIIHARNEKDAIKYAKKRGLYNGETPIKIEQK